MLDLPNTRTGETPSAALDTPILADVVYSAARREVTERRVRIDAVVALPSGAFGVQAFCELRGAQRHFKFHGFRKIAVVSPDDMRRVTNGRDLQCALADKIAKLRQSLLAEHLRNIDHDPRLVILAAAGQAAMAAGKGGASEQVRAEAIRRIAAFMGLAVRWINEWDHDAAAAFLLDEITVDAGRLSRALDGVYDRTIDEVFFEAAGLVFLAPSSKGTRLLKKIHAAFSARSHERPPPWAR